MVGIVVCMILSIIVYIVNMFLSEEGGLLITLADVVLVTIASILAFSCGLGLYGTLIIIAAVCGFLGRMFYGANVVVALPFIVGNWILRVAVVTLILV